MPRAPMRPSGTPGTATADSLVGRPLSVCPTSAEQWCEGRSRCVQSHRQSKRYGEVHVLMADRSTLHHRQTERLEPFTHHVVDLVLGVAEVTDHQACDLVEPPGPQQLREQPVHPVPVLADVLQYDDTLRPRVGRCTDACGK